MFRNLTSFVDKCFTFFEQPTIIHEMLHVLSVKHEHQRPDRNKLNEKEMTYCLNQTACTSKKKISKNFGVHHACAAWDKENLIGRHLFSSKRAMGRAMGKSASVLDQCSWR
jgi:hypothetical protein